MNYNYDQRCISLNDRRFNGIEAFEIVEVNSTSKEVTFRRQYGGETVRIHPSDFEITNYENGAYCDLMISTLNGYIRSAQLLGPTPPTFIPEE